MEYDAAFIAIGNPNKREKLAERVGKELFTLIHPSAVEMQSAEMRKGYIIEAGAIVSNHAELGTGTLLWAIQWLVTMPKSVRYNCSVSERSTVPDKTKVDCNAVWRE